MRAPRDISTGRMSESPARLPVANRGPAWGRDGIYFGPDATDRYSDIFSVVSGKQVILSAFPTEVDGEMPPVYLRKVVLSSQNMPDDGFKFSSDCPGGTWEYRNQTILYETYVADSYDGYVNIASLRSNIRSIDIPGYYVLMVPEGYDPSMVIVTYTNVDHIFPIGPSYSLSGQRAY